ncbi:BQ5605_C049g12424 [Microbotryum silenes-dioicae]|uniref:BQ5605_C049g12424 protein n=1 Tax=Microbotryum silenes-dioicae TaxID=796604 RepID=A0A2X0MPQ5_9BASI|nr:BQ5605_C049g12424 [Microbotryum silenes-dioicae]
MSYSYGEIDSLRSPSGSSYRYLSAQDSISRESAATSAPAFAHSREEDDSCLPSPTFPLYGQYGEPWPTPRNSLSGHSGGQELAYGAPTPFVHRSSYDSSSRARQTISDPTLQTSWNNEWSYANTRQPHTGLPTGYFAATSHSYPSSSYGLPVPLSPQYISGHSLPPLSVLSANPYTPTVAPRPPNGKTFSSTSASSFHGGRTSSEADSQPSFDDDAPKPFILKLYHMLANPSEFSDVISWDPPGTSFVVSHNERFTRDVLPALFGHGNIASFTRQLNVYNFVRLTTSELRSMLGQQETNELSGWRHTLLVRGDEAGLYKLKPRPSKARQAKKAERAKKVVTDELEINSPGPNPGQDSAGVGPTKSHATSHQAQHQKHPYAR